LRISFANRSAASSYASPDSHGRAKTSAGAGSSPATLVQARHAPASRRCFSKSFRTSRHGAVCIDDKGLYWETLSQMAKHFGREDDLILLQVRPDGAASSWRPRHAYNLTSDRSIPYNTQSSIPLPVSASPVTRAFFRNQAQTQIASALETLREIGADVTLENAYQLLLDQGDVDEAMSDLASRSSDDPPARVGRAFHQSFSRPATRADRRRERDDRQLPPGIHHTGDRSSLLSWCEHIRLCRTSTAERLSASLCRDSTRSSRRSRSSASAATSKCTGIPADSQGRTVLSAAVSLPATWG
jgi:hypothetical protein